MYGFLIFNLLTPCLISHPTQTYGKMEGCLSWLICLRGYLVLCMQAPLFNKFIT